MAEPSRREPRSLPIDTPASQHPETMDRNLLFGEVLMLLRDTVHKLPAWEASDLTVQALAARNAVVNIDNAFGNQFHEFNRSQADTIHIDTIEEVDFIIHGLHDIFDLIVGQLPSEPIHTPTKIVVQQPEIFAQAFGSMILEMKKIEIQCSQLRAKPVDIILMMLSELYTYWQNVSNGV